MKAALRVLGRHLLHAIRRWPDLNTLLPLIVKDKTACRHLRPPLQVSSICASHHQTSAGLLHPPGTLATWNTGMIPGAAGETRTCSGLDLAWVTPDNDEVKLCSQREEVLVLFVCIVKQLTSERDQVSLNPRPLRNRSFRWNRSACDCQAQGLCLAETSQTPARSISRQPVPPLYIPLPGSSCTRPSPMSRSYCLSQKSAC